MKLNLPLDGQEPLNRSVQELLDSPINKMKFQQLLDNGNSEEKAILLSTSSENASCWVHSVPVNSLGLKLDNPSFQIVCGLRIGAKICSPYICRCGAKVNEYGRHGLSCPKAAGRFRRHSGTNNLVKKALASITLEQFLSSSNYQIP